ncbi:hypothetical protein KSP39_PZI009514 [Platanthera zijinensis]|uniref:Uncharacterized protein n=1 Tax=Platanthera zijinensis TaxID=2320716 RepID=A0AAP0BK77_9ASPA
MIYLGKIFSLVEGLQRKIYDFALVDILSDLTIMMAKFNLLLIFLAHAANFFLCGKLILPASAAIQFRRTIVLSTCSSSLSSSEEPAVVDLLPAELMTSVFFAGRSFLLPKLCRLTTTHEQSSSPPPSPSADPRSVDPKRPVPASGNFIAFKSVPSAVRHSSDLLDAAVTAPLTLLPYEYSPVYQLADAQLTYCFLLEPLEEIIFELLTGRKKAAHREVSEIRPPPPPWFPAAPPASKLVCRWWDFGIGGSMHRRQYTDSASVVSTSPKEVRCASRQEYAGVRLVHQALRRTIGLTGSALLV